MQQLINNYFVVQVPEDAKDFVIPLPGSYSIIGKGDELTEEQWDDIVEMFWWEEQDNIQAWQNQFDWFKDYNNDNNGFTSQTESGLSLLSSKNLNPETSLILLKH